MILIIGVRTVSGQTMTLPETIPGDTTVIGFVPVAIYTSDIGFLGGVSIHRFNYHPLVQPYISLTELRVMASTKGLIDFRVMYEQTETFGHPVRSRWRLYGERHPADTYFGVGNQSEFDNDLWSDGFYNFEARRAGFKWSGRRTLYRADNFRGLLDLTASTGIHYEIAVENEDELMAVDGPRGMEGGHITTFGTGLLWENRDNEFAATRGNRVSLAVDWAPGSFFGDFPMAKFKTDIRQYITLPVPYFQPVLAMRGSGSLVTGSAPYWELPYLGDEYTLRGYPIHRFRGRASTFYNIELRTWIYEIPHYDFKIGVHAFHDGGRVYDYGDDLSDLFRDYHRTFGGGIATALFTPDFILRIDTGFSDEMFRLYMNVGYMF